MDPSEVIRGSYVYYTPQLLRKLISFNNTIRPLVFLKKIHKGIFRYNQLQLFDNDKLSSPIFTHNHLQLFGIFDLPPRLSIRGQILIYQQILHYAVHKIIRISSDLTSFRLSFSCKSRLLTYFQKNLDGYLQKKGQWLF